MHKVNLAQKFALFHEHWSPKLVGAFNGQEIKLAKLQGEFVWHAHEHEDELFLVIQGQLRILLEDGEVALGPGEFYIVPKGVRHKPVAEEEVQVVLIEPAGTVNTGDAGGDRTVQPAWL
jgi:mannose-6-phosphate isomerase-like protein (cupin superfamily)